MRRIILVWVLTVWTCWAGKLQISRFLGQHKLLRNKQQETGAADPIYVIPSLAEERYPEWQADIKGTVSPLKAITAFLVTLHPNTAYLALCRGTQTAGLSASLAFPLGPIAMHPVMCNSHGGTARGRSANRGGLNFPSHVSTFAVEPVAVHWSAELPSITTLVVSSDPDVDGLLSITHPNHPRERVISELVDAHGVLGVWPSARVAVAKLAAVAPARRRRVLEFGAGAGLPSLVAALDLPGVERVLSTDVEALPLDLLKTAYAAQVTESAAKLETKVLDVCDVDSARAVVEEGGFDLIVAADMLYNLDVATSLGTLFGAMVSKDTDQGKTHPMLIVCDPGRRGRDAFLEAFFTASGCTDATFVDVDVPSVDGLEGATDIFDGSVQSSVGVFRWRHDNVSL